MRMSQRARPHQAPTTRPKPRIAERHAGVLAREEVGGRGAIDGGHHTDREEQQPQHVHRQRRSLSRPARDDGGGRRGRSHRCCLAWGRNLVHARRTRRRGPAHKQDAARDHDQREREPGDRPNRHRPVQRSHHGLHRVQEEHGADDGEDDPRDGARGSGIHPDAPDPTLDDGAVATLDRNEQPRQQVDEEAGAVEQDEPHERHADEQGIDIEIVGQSGRDASGDTVVGAPAQSGGGGSGSGLCRGRLGVRFGHAAIVGD